MSPAAKKTPPLTFHPAVSAALEKHYRSSNVILEYGSGGSTILASQLKGKLVFSVESDKKWFDNLLPEIVSGNSEVKLIYENIGPTAKWGYPADPTKWKRYINYPLNVWEHPDFVDPDLVLIDGRFRTACFITVLLFCNKPTTILFDDYKERKFYSKIEEFTQPIEFIESMARFEVQPNMVEKRTLLTALRLYFNER